MRATDSSPKPPIIVFWNGDQAEYVTHKVIHKKDGLYWRINMIVDENTIEKYNLEEEIQRNEADGYELTSIDRDYPLEYIKELPTDHAQPVILLFCNFDSVLMIDTDIQEMVSQMRRMSKSNQVLRIENDRLRKLYKEVVEAKRETEGT